MSRVTLAGSLVAVFLAGIGLQSTLHSQGARAPRKRGPDELLRLSLVRWSRIVDAAQDAAVHEMP